MVLGESHWELEANSMAFRQKNPKPNRSLLEVRLCDMIYNTSPQTRGNIC